MNEVVRNIIRLLYMYDTIDMAVLLQLFVYYESLLSYIYLALCCLH